MAARSPRPVSDSTSETGGSVNALACAAACESLAIFRDEDVLAKNEIKAKMIAAKVKVLVDSHPHVGEYRHLGMIGALELVEDKRTKKPFDWQRRVGYEIYKIALDKGVLMIYRLAIGVLAALAVAIIVPAQGYADPPTKCLTNTPKGKQVYVPCDLLNAGANFPPGRP